MVRLGHVHLPVPELARSVAFYRDKLGLEVGYASDSLVEFPAAGLVLDQESGFTRLSAPVTVGLAVDDVDSVFAELVGHDVPITEPPRDRPWGVRNFYVTDPYGYVIEFEQPKTAPA
jgi:catechol 2,3-dioxygenase-like lactoylglutathione lyase family enzyme